MVEPRDEDADQAAEIERELEEMERAAAEKRAHLMRLKEESKFKKLASSFQQSVDNTEEFNIFKQDTFERIDQIIKLISDLRQSFVARNESGLGDQLDIDDYMSCIQVDKDKLEKKFVTYEEANKRKMVQTLEKNEKEAKGFKEYIKKCNTGLAEYIKMLAEMEAPKTLTNKTERVPQMKPVHQYLTPEE